MRKRAAFIASFTTALAIFVAGGSSFGQDQVKKIRADYISPSPHYFQFFLAQEQGIMAEQRLDLELVKMDPGTGVLFAAKGQLDFATALTQSYLAKSKGQPLEIVCTIVDKVDFAILTQQSIRTPADLKGKKVGISSTTSILVLPLEKLLSGAGLSLNDVELVPIKSSVQRVVQVMAGNLDATVIDFANAIHALKRGYTVFELFYDLPFIGVAVRKEDALQLGSKLTAAFFQTMKFAREHPEETVALLKKWMPSPGLEDQDYRQIYERFLRMLTNNCVASTEAMDNLKRYLTTVAK